MKRAPSASADAEVMPNPRTRLYGVDALRGITACVVVLFHVAEHVDHAKPAPLLLQVMRFGHAAGDLFFVLSEPAPSCAPGAATLLPAAALPCDHGAAA